MRVSKHGTHSPAMPPPGPAKNEPRVNGAKGGKGMESIGDALTGGGVTYQHAPTHPQIIQMRLKGSEPAGSHRGTRAITACTMLTTVKGL